MKNASEHITDHSAAVLSKRSITECHVGGIFKKSKLTIEKLHI